MIIVIDLLPFIEKRHKLSNTSVLVKLLEQFKINIASKVSSKIETKIKTSSAHLSIIFNTL